MLLDLLNKSELKRDQFEQGKKIRKTNDDLIIFIISSPGRGSVVMDGSNIAR